MFVEGGKKKAAVCEGRVTCHACVRIRSFHTHRYRPDIVVYVDQVSKQENCIIQWSPLYSTSE